MNDPPSERLPESSPAPKPPGPRAHLPRVPPVFGKYGFVICVMPYLVFLLGNQASSWLDSSRAHNYVASQRSTLASYVELAVKRAEQRAVTDDDQKAVQDLRVTELKREIQEPEKLNVDKVERMLQRFLDPNGPIPATGRETVEDEWHFLVELNEAEEKKLYRDVLEKGYQRRLTKDPEAGEATPISAWFPDDRTYYPTIYMITIVATTLATLIVFPGYFRVPINYSSLSLAVGVVGIVIWIALWHLQRLILPGLTPDVRAAFNPFVELQDNPQWRNLFLIIRFFGLVILVPFVEEFFLRGWLVRYCDDPDWDEMPIGFVGLWGWVGVIVYAVFSHPGEAVAALAWFSMVTWLYIRTRSIWNCVIAHAITNLLLGLYVIYFKAWALW